MGKEISRKTQKGEERIKILVEKGKKDQMDQNIK